MSEIKVGNKVKLLRGAGRYPLIGFSNNEIYEVVAIGLSRMYHIQLVGANCEGYADLNQVEKIEEIENMQTEMTFPEMAQKLIDGEFEVGTELVITDEDELEVTFYVTKNMYGYGISRFEDFEPTIVSNPSHINGKWKVKEQPIKEMSIEEVQKELGYKIKIVE